MAGEAGASTARLLEAVQGLRTAVAQVTLPLDLPAAATARLTRTRLLDQLDDYVVPRLTSIDAPLLAVVGGSTGAGKSTLVNSVIGQQVSLPGVLRPTTRSPVLVHHPSDAAWFSGQRILPGLARITGRRATTGAPSGAGGQSSTAGQPSTTGRSNTAGHFGTAGSDGPGAVRLATAEAIVPGLALLDAPDIDSVVEANRDLAGQLLAAADLWIFVTTAARYADAVPWDLLREASERGTAVAVVLDRVSAASVDEIRAHLSEMLRDQGLERAPIFTVLECELVGGMLPDEQVEQLRGWLGALAGDAQARAVVVRQTLEGALASLDTRTRALVEAGTEQTAAGDALVNAAHAAYDDAALQVHAGMEDGSLLRGEVLARWQEFVGTGEFFRQVESTVSRVRDRFTSFLKGEPARATNLGEALQSGVEALVANRAELAASTTARSWRVLPGGDQLLAADPGLTRSSGAAASTTERLVRDWQGDILQMVRDEGRDRRTSARIMAYGVNGLGVVLMLVTFASTAGVTGAEIGIAGGTAVVGQKLLEAVFGDQAVRALAKQAREQLMTRVTELYAAEQARYDAAVATVHVGAEQTETLVKAAAAVRGAR